MTTRLQHDNPGIIVLDQQRTWTVNNIPEEKTYAITKAVKKITAKAKVKTRIHIRRIHNTNADLIFHAHARTTEETNKLIQLYHDLTSCKEEPEVRLRENLNKGTYSLHAKWKVQDQTQHQHIYQKIKRYSKQSGLNLRRDNRQLKQQLRVSEANETLLGLLKYNLSRMNNTNKCLHYEVKKSINALQKLYKLKPAFLCKADLPRIAQSYPWMQSYMKDVEPLHIENIVQGNLKTTFINIDGQTKKKLDHNHPFMRKIMMETKPDILCILDTRNKFKPTKQLPGYTLKVWKKPPERTKADINTKIGGMAIYMKSTLHMQLSVLKSNKKHDILWYAVQSSNEDNEHAYGIVYCRPKTKKNKTRCAEFYNQINVDIAEMNQLKTHTTIMGDWNARVAKHSADQQLNWSGKQLLQLTKSHNLRMANVEFARNVLTFVSANGGSIIDHVVTNADISDLRVDDDPIYMAHRPITITSMDSTKQGQAYPNMLSEHQTQTQIEKKSNMNRAF